MFRDSTVTVTSAHITNLAEPHLLAIPVLFALPAGSQFPPMGLFALSPLRSVNANPKTKSALPRRSTFVHLLRCVHGRANQYHAISFIGRRMRQVVGWRAVPLRSVVGVGDSTRHLRPCSHSGLNAFITPTARLSQVRERRGSYHGGLPPPCCSRTRARQRVTLVHAADNGTLAGSPRTHGAHADGTKKKKLVRHRGSRF